MKELTASHFRAWLEAHSPRLVVGQARHEDGCPLATYLGPGWRVRRATARSVEPEALCRGRAPEVRVVQLPRWARRFVAAVDDLHGYGGGQRRVWPRLALQLLDEAVRGAKQGAGR